MAITRSLMTTGAGAAVLGLGLTLTAATAASAHVTADPNTTAAGSYTLMTVSVPHGCEGKATTEVEINLPKELSGVTPTVNPNWDIKQVHDKDDESKDVTAIDYIAKKPLAADQRDSFELSFYIPPQTEGKTLAFPTTQTCSEGETTWDQVPKSGQSDDDLDTPAPSFTVTEAAATDDSAHSHEPSSEAAPKAVQADNSSTTALTLGIVGAVLGALGLIVGGAALLRTRRGA